MEADTRIAAGIRLVKRQPVFGGGHVIPAQAGIRKPDPSRVTPVQMAPDLTESTDYYPDFLCDLCVLCGE